jgi:Iap family predicted aminopeptidase
MQTSELGTWLEYAVCSQMEHEIEYAPLSVVQDLCCDDVTEYDVFESVRNNVMDTVHTIVRSCGDVIRREVEGYD